MSIKIVYNVSFVKFPAQMISQQFHTDFNIYTY